MSACSRTTIREVLRELDAEGLVTTIPQRGAIVVVPTPEEAADLYDVRASLEALAARRFVERASAEHLGALRESVDAFEAVVREHADTLTLLRAKDAIYDVLLDGAGSQAIRSILGGLLGRGNDDDRTALWNRRHEPLGVELAQDLADRRARDPDLLDKLTLDQALPGLVAEVEDRVADDLEHLVAQRRRDAPDPHRCLRRGLEKRVLGHRPGSIALPWADAIV